MIAACLVVLGVALLTLVVGLAYLRWLRLPRPPIGVFNGSDVLALVVGVVLAPLLYLVLPAAVAGALFGLTLLSVLLFSLQPLPLPRGARWLTALALVASTALVGLHSGAGSTTFAVLNGTLIVCCVAGIANLWVQTGMRVRHLVALSAALTAYDLVATAWLPVTSSMMAQLGSTPFAPLVFWPGPGQTLGLGLGDLLVLTTATLVAYQGYGRTAALGVSVSSVLAVAAVLVAVSSRTVTGVVPTMAVLGPCTLLACWVLRRLPRPERTVREFLHDQSGGRQPVTPDRPQTPRPGAERSAPLSVQGGETQ